jgi:signal transduction histidine kinase
LNGARADRVTLEVTNTGVVPAEILPHLFDPFRGGQRQLGRREGLGLGLYIVQQIVVAHGGRVDVRTDERRTTFWVELPRRPAA